MARERKKLLLWQSFPGLGYLGNYLFRAGDQDNRWFLRLRARK